jgi:uncharacterized protein (TIGR03000 family)
MAPATSTPEPRPETITPPRKDGASLRAPPPNTARLIVELPASAKLYVDDQPMKATSARRVFRTPSLEPGQSYYYMLRAELVRDGKTYQESKKVVLRPGDEIRASFADLDEMRTAEVSSQAKP